MSKKIALTKMEAKAKRRHKAALKHGMKMAPNATFVESCKRFYEERGYLSLRQVEALENMVSARLEPSDEELDEWFSDSPDLPNSW